MTTAYTSLLGLALPVTGELQGTWGDTVNNSITSLLDTAISGTTTLSTDADVTLTTTTGAANQARQAIILCSGARTALRTITAPAQSKIYTIINATTGGYSVKLVGAGPTTGLTIPNGASAVVAWNGSDFIEVGSATVGNLTVNGNLSVTGTTSLTGVATLTANPVLSAGTANGVAYLNGSKVVTTGSALTFDGTNLGIGAAPTGYGKLDVKQGTNYRILFSGNAAYGSNGIVGITDAGAETTLGLAGTPIAFYVQASEQMRLTSTGLGIGTSSPGTKLHVTGSNGLFVQFLNSANNTGEGLVFGSGSNLGRMSTNGANTAMAFEINAVERMRLDSSGNLGLGVTPSTILDIGANNNTPKTISLRYSTVPTYLSSSYDGSVGLTTLSCNSYNTSNGSATWSAFSNTGYGNAALQLTAATTGSDIRFLTAAAANTNPTERARIDSSGNLGIGTSSPYAKLQVVASSADYVNPQVMVGEASVSTGKQLHIGYNTTANTGYIQAVHNGTGYKDLLLQPNGGNLGLGVTPSAWASGFRAIQIANAAAITSQDNFMLLASNAYWDGTNYRRISAASASRYLQANGGIHYWETAGSSTAGSIITFTQAMTLDASGNLGVGTTSPGTRLHVNSAAIDEVARFEGTGNPYISVYDSGTRQLYLGSVGASDVDLWVETNKNLRFATNNTERARITSSGYFKASNTGTYQNSTATYHELYNDANSNTVRITNAKTSGFTDAVVQVSFNQYAPNDGTAVFLWCNDTSAVRTKILSNGGLANYSANDVNLSDRREKTNFAPAGNYLAKICAIPVQTFNYIDQSEDDPGLTLGVVAQDVQAVAPELVMESNWGTEEEPKMRLSIYQTDLQYALMKCIQEQQAIIEQLKADVAALKGN